MFTPHKSRAARDSLRRMVPIRGTGLSSCDKNRATGGRNVVFSQSMKWLLRFTFGFFVLLLVGCGTNATDSQTLRTPASVPANKLQAANSSAATPSNIYILPPKVYLLPKGEPVPPAEPPPAAPTSLQGDAPDVAASTSPSATPAVPSPASSTQCAAITKKGVQCSRLAEAGSAYCWQHAK